MTVNPSGVAIVPPPSTGNVDILIVSLMMKSAAPFPPWVIAGTHVFGVSVSSYTRCAHSSIASPFVNHAVLMPDLHCNVYVIVPPLADIHRLMGFSAWNWYSRVRWRPV